MGARFSAPVETGRGAVPASCKMGTVSFPGLKSGRGVTLTPHPLLVPWSRKSIAITLLSLWAVRPVQSHSAYTRVHFSLLLFVEGKTVACMPYVALQTIEANRSWSCGGKGWEVTASGGSRLTKSQLKLTPYVMLYYHRRISIVVLLL